MDFFRLLTFAVFLTAQMAMGCAPALAEESSELRIGGGDGAKQLILRLAKVYARKGIGLPIRYVDGLGGAGAIKAVSDGALDFAISPRHLTLEEQVMGLKQVPFAKTPIVLATSSSAPGSLSSEDVARVLRNEIRYWDNGEPIKLIFRLRSNAISNEVADQFPGAAKAMEQARNRIEVPIAASSQDSAALAEHVPGSFLFISMTQVVAENRKLTLVPIDGVVPTLDNFSSGRYPYGRTLFLIAPYAPSPALQAWLSFLETPEAHEVMRLAAAAPPPLLP